MSFWHKDRSQAGDRKDTISQTYSWVVTLTQSLHSVLSHPLPLAHLSGILCPSPRDSSAGTASFVGHRLSRSKRHSRIWTTTYEIWLFFFTHSFLKPWLWPLISESRVSLKSCGVLKRIVHENSSIWKDQSQEKGNRWNRGEGRLGDSHMRERKSDWERTSSPPLMLLNHALTPQSRAQRNVNQ